MSLISPKTALVSLSDKSNLDQLIEFLLNKEVKIISTGGTFNAIKKITDKVLEVSEFTGFEEMMDGRVKTLHPKIHAGILARRETDLEVLTDRGFEVIDMVVVNLYPFKETIASGCSFEEAIEKIDIGGPTMIRAAAKNFKDVAVISDPNDYSRLMDEWNSQGGISYTFRKELSQKVFQLMTEYNASIAYYLKDISSNAHQYNFEKSESLRYGENPHQTADLLTFSNLKHKNIANADVIQGKELSYNNIVDADAAWECVRAFDEPACVIVKHANPCGVAESDNLLKAYNYAYKTDPVSAFGGIIAFNKPLDSKLLKKIISQQFVEVILAPGFDNNCIDILKSKPNIRLLLVDKSKNKSKEIEMKTLKNKMLIQETDSVILNEKDLKYITKKKPTKKQVDDLLFAFKVSRYVKSNSIVFAKDSRTLGIGAGQMSRIDSTNIAKSKAKNHKISLKGCVMASEAFFPFRDNIDLAKKIGVVAIIQPGGSIKDKDIIEVVDKYKMSMVLSGVRVFKH